MLSRVANRIYWMSRYMERAGNLARLIDSTSELMYDLPRSFTSHWSKLITVFEADAVFDSLYASRTENNVVRFLLNHPENPGSVVNSVAMARENARAVRDILSRELWEAINELYLESSNLDREDISRSQRGRATAIVRHGCQHYLGVLSETLSRNQSYNFCLLGLYLERSDMVVRLLQSQVGSDMLLSDEELDLYQVSLWRSFLSSLGAYHMYLSSSHAVVDSEQALRFIVSDQSFPRSVYYCLKNVERAIQKLPGGRRLKERVAPSRRALSQKDLKLWQEGKVQDELLEKLSRIHNEIEKHYFLP